MVTCQQGTLCQIHLCVSSKQIWNHFSQCSKQNCLLCSPVKEIGLILSDDVRHLASLLHAQKCVQEASQQCTIPDCVYGTFFLNHLAICREYVFCQESYCLASKRILWHWRSCLEKVCHICSPLRQEQPMVVSQSPRQLNTYDAKRPQESNMCKVPSFWFPTARENAASTFNRPKPHVGEASSEEKEDVRSYLKIMVHALLCCSQSQVPAKSGEECTFPACASMKKLFHHINSCHEGESCTTTLCFETKPILSHLRLCTNRDCPYCSQQPQTSPNAHPTQQPLVGDLRSVQPGAPTLAQIVAQGKKLMIENPTTLPPKQLTVGHSGLQGQVATEPSGQGKTKRRSPVDVGNRNKGASSIYDHDNRTVGRR
ncbi:Hypothetical predicted protein [Cloeon dipterum]|nr:Hypothetical predicted protein [Cloeon dipterum]